MCGETLPGSLASARPLEGRLNRRDGLAVELHEMSNNDVALLPPPHVSEEPPRDRHGRLALVRFLLALLQAIKDTSVKVDDRTADGGNWRRRRDRTSACPRIQADQDEPGEMAQWALLCGQ